MKRVFICNTVFQIMVAIWINHRYFHKEDSDLIISNHMNNGDKIAKRMQTNDRFSHVYYVESFEVSRYRVPKSRLENTRMKLHPAQALNRLFGVPCNYEELFVSNLDGFTELFFAASLEQNPQIKIHIFEDGLSTYSQWFESRFNDSGWPDFCLPYRLIFKHIYKRKHMKDYIADVWLLSPEIIQWNPEVPIKVLDKIDIGDKEYLNICNSVFGYNDSTDIYDKKYIFLEQCFLEEGISAPDIELVNQIANRVGKDNIMVKIHPRDKTNRFNKLGYKTNTDMEIPWEVICMNMPDIEEKVLLTIGSGSILNPIMIFGIPVKAYSLYNIIRDMEGGEELVQNAPSLWKTVVPIFEKFYPAIKICKTLDEITQ